jgi:hypothetical protein
VLAGGALVLAERLLAERLLAGWASAVPARPFGLLFDLSR